MERVLGAVGPTHSAAPSGEPLLGRAPSARRGLPVTSAADRDGGGGPGLGAEPRPASKYLAGWTHDAPIFLLCLSRPDLLEERQGWLTATNVTGVVLAPLTDAEAD